MRSRGGPRWRRAGSGPSDGSPREVTPISGPNILLPFQPATMSEAAAVRIEDYAIGILGFMTDNSHASELFAQP